MYTHQQFAKSLNNLLLNLKYFETLILSLKNILTFYFIIGMLIKYVAHKNPNVGIYIEDREYKKHYLILSPA